MEDSLKYANEKVNGFENELIEFLKIPSISISKENRNDVSYCAEWLSKHLQLIGIDSAEVIATERHPIVYGEFIHSKKAPTILIYGHYDVQPTDPITEWKYEPFEPHVSNGNIYARGASDNKGQIFAILKGIESLIKTDNLNVNLKIIIEGEEEVFSPSLSTLLQRSQERFACDAILISDTTMYDIDTRGTPRI